MIDKCEITLVITARTYVTNGDCKYLFEHVCTNF